MGHGTGRTRLYSRAGAQCEEPATRCRTRACRRSGSAQALLQDALQSGRAFSAEQSRIGTDGRRSSRPFRPTPTLALRTHVPRADDPPTDQALAPRAGARCRGNGTRVRDAGRGNARPRPRSAAGSPARRGASGRAGRPHRRAPASPADPSSAPPAPRRQRPPTRTGVPHAGRQAGAQARLTARRRPVWEDGSAGRPGALPGAPDFNASRAALHGAARVRCGLRYTRVLPGVSLLAASTVAAGRRGGSGGRPAFVHHVNGRSGAADAPSTGVDLDIRGERRSSAPITASTGVDRDAKERRSPARDRAGTGVALTR